MLRKSIASFVLHRKRIFESRRRDVRGDFRILPERSSTTESPRSLSRTAKAAGNLTLGGRIASAYTGPMAGDQDGKRTVRSRFGAAAEAYATSDVHARGESLAVLRELIRPRPDWKVLDLASGAGHTAFRFAPDVDLVLATDLTMEMSALSLRLAIDKEISNVHAVVADAESLPLPDGGFDLVTCRLAFHHFPDPLQALAEIGRALKPAGVLGFTDNYTVDSKAAAQYYNRFEQLRDPSHHCVYSLPELTKMFDRTGFQIEASRRLVKTFEFESWAGRQNADAATRRELLDMMRKVPPALQDFFAPRWSDGTLYFQLWEVVLVAGRRSRSG